jgi:hypothetical protein
MTPAALLLASAALAAQDSPLVEAVRKCRKAEVEALVGRGADVNVRSSVRGRPPVQLAFLNDCHDVAWYLLDNGADVDQADDEGTTLLWWAAKEGSLGPIQTVLSYGADPRKKAWKGKRPIDQLPPDSRARAFFDWKPFSELQRKTDFDRLPKRTRERLEGGLLVWGGPARPVVLPSEITQDKPYGWSSVERTANRWLARALLWEAGRPPAAPVVVQGAYETKADFAARVERERLQYEAAARARDEKVRAFPLWKRRAILEASIAANFGEPRVVKTAYDADKQVFSAVVEAAWPGWTLFKQAFKLSDKVPAQKAEAFEKSLAAAGSRIVFRVDGDSISVTGAEFDVLGGIYKAAPQDEGDVPVRAVVALQSAAAPAAAPVAAAYAPAPAAKRSDVDEAAAASAGRPSDFAVVVGVEGYQEAGMPAASYAERDADAVAANLIGLGLPKENVVVLKGPQATSAKLKAYLESYLPKNVKPESTVYFYFSGHGTPDPETRQAYLVPWDASPKFIKESGLPISSLYASLGRLNVKQTLIAMDACFSGSGERSVFLAGARPLVSVREDSELPERVTVLAAAQNDQIARSLDDQGHGVFTYYFLKGIRGGSKDTTELCPALTDGVKAAAARLNGVQTPVCRGPAFAFR